VYVCSHNFVQTKQVDLFTKAACEVVMFIFLYTLLLVTVMFATAGGVQRHFFM